MPLTLEQSCIVWADQHWPECHASMSKGDRRHYLKCLGAVVRRRATAEPSWLWGWIARDSQQVLTLSPYIGRFTAKGYEMPPADQGWGDYCRMMRALEDGVWIVARATTSGPSEKEIDVPGSRRKVSATTRTGRLSEAARPGLFV
jgi:hypothetical protein